MKNTKLRPQDIKYDPVRQEKKPLWMHSVEGPRTDVSGIQVFAVFGVVIILATCLILMLC